MFTIQDLNLIVNSQQYSQNRRLRRKVIEDFFINGFEQLGYLITGNVPMLMNPMTVASKKYLDKINDKLLKSRNFNEAVKREFKDHLDCSDQNSFYDKASGLDFDGYKYPAIIAKLNLKKDKEEHDLINGAWFLLYFLDYIEKQLLFID